MVRSLGKVKRFKEMQRAKRAGAQRAGDTRVYYEVERIVSRKIIRGKIYYEVKWAGFDTSENTLQSKQSLRFCKPLITAFHEELMRRREHNEGDYFVREDDDHDENQGRGL